MEFLKLSSQKSMLICFVVFFIAGCGIFEPYIDRRRNPGVQDLNRLYSGPSTPDKPVICYNGLLTDDEELQVIANEECVKQETGNYAEFVKKTHLTGKLLLPSHAYYRCMKKED